MTDKPPSFRFAWWNTGIAPPWVQSAASPEQREIVARVIERLVVKEECALMGLGEMRRESLLSVIPTHLRPQWMELRDMSSSDRNDFDIGLLYDRSRFTLETNVWVKVPWIGSEVRAGLVAVLKSVDVVSSVPFIVVLAHWRSDMGNVVDAAARRSRAAQALRAAVSKCIDDTGSAAYVIALGDFNTEPFNGEFSTDLPTSRSRDVVRDHSRGVGTDDLLLYNPCWRLLGEQRPWTGVQARSLAGTYRIGNSPSAWRTFDQVLVSASLLGTSQWVLREDELRVWTDDIVLEPGEPKKFLSSSIDHLPVVGLLQWIDDPLAQGKV